MKKKMKKELNYKKSFDGLNKKNLIVANDSRLPSPVEIAKALKNSRITILLEQDTVDFFKREAQRNRVSYQQMIREVLRQYVEGIKRAA